MGTGHFCNKLRDMLLATVFKYEGFELPACEGMKEGGVQ
jgi:hypothetical protein